MTRESGAEGNALADRATLRSNLRVGTHPDAISDDLGDCRSGHDGYTALASVALPPLASIRRSMQPIGCSIAPWLSLRNGARAVEFYKSAFGAIEVYRMEDPSGSVVSRLSVEGAEFWLSDESPEHGNFSPESLGGGTARMILTVPDPDATFAKALAAGGERNGN